VKAVLALMLVARGAAADGGHSFATIGGTFGGTYDAHGAGGLIGGEVSGGWFDTNAPWPSPPRPADDVPIPVDIPDVHKWIGGYFDALYDTSIHQARISIGPELGIERFGADSGVVIEPNTRRIGWALRIGAHVGPLWAFVRGVQLFDRQPDSSRLEYGVQLKLPYPFE
jgi:hypothetical protein